MSKFFIKHPTWNKWKNIMKKLIIAAVISFGVGFGVNKVNWTNFQDSFSRMMGVGCYTYGYTCYNCGNYASNYIPKDTLVCDFVFRCSTCDAIYSCKD